VRCLKAYILKTIALKQKKLLNLLTNFLRSFQIYKCPTSDIGTLIQSILEYHHIPDHIKNFIKNLYTDFKTSVITSEFRTPFITVGRGVLQGGCFSPLLFNM
jgi:hypothetical protein